MEKISYQQFKKLYTEKEHREREQEKLQTGIKAVRETLIKKLEERPVSLGELLESIPSEYVWIREKIGIKGIFKGYKNIKKRYDEDGKLYYGLATK